MCINLLDPFAAGVVPGRGGNGSEAATNLFEEAHALLAHQEISAAELNRATVTALHHRLRALRNEYQKQKRGAVRTLHDCNLLMVEQGPAIYLWHPHPPPHGYKLAVTYCEHDDTPYGPG
jgi:hypothetical protein